jgi:hypothetical protein
MDDPFSGTANKGETKTGEKSFPSPGKFDVAIFFGFFF